MVNTQNMSDKWTARKWKSRERAGEDTDVLSSDQRVEEAGIPRK